MKSPPLVLIEWEDSRQPVSNWKWVSDYDDVNIVMCVSVGWLIKDTKDIKALAPNLGDTEEETAQVSGVIQIPTCCIKRIVKLKQPK